MNSFFKHEPVAASSYSWQLLKVTFHFVDVVSCVILHVCVKASLHVTLFPDLYSLTRVSQPMLLTQGCFGKAWCWHWHRLVAGQWGAELTGAVPSLASCSAAKCATLCVCLLLISRLFSPLSRNRIWGSLARSPVCLHPACVQRHNRSPKAESVPVSAPHGGTFLRVWIGWLCICSI